MHHIHTSRLCVTVRNVLHSEGPGLALSLVQRVRSGIKGMVFDAHLLQPYTQGKWRKVSPTLWPVPNGPWQW